MSSAMIGFDPLSDDSIGSLWCQLRLSPVDGALWFQLYRQYQQAGLAWQAGYGFRQLRRINPALAQADPADGLMLAQRDDLEADGVLGQVPGPGHGPRINDFLAWVQQSPGDWLTWLYLGRLLELVPHDGLRVHWPTPQEAMQRAVALEPIAGESQHWLGVWRLNSGDGSRAVAAFATLLEIRPVRYGSMMFLGEALLRTGQREAAEKAFTRASMSSNPAFLRELAQRVYHHNYWMEALEILNNVLRVEPNSVATLQALLTIHWEVYNLSEVRQICQRILALEPTNGDVGYMLSALPGRMGDAKGHFEAVQAKFAQIQDRTSRLVSSIAMASLYQDYLSPQQIADLHYDLVAPIEQELRVLDTEFAVANRGERLKIGLVSGDFHRQHPVNLFMLPVLRNLNHRRFEVFIYNIGSMQDEYTLMAKASVDHWIEASKLDDHALQQMICRDGVQVLIDLAGHTTNHRLGLFAMRAAPVQVTFLGYPHSTGLSSMDWLIGDRLVSPIDHQHLFSEGLAQLPNSVFCWSPVDSYPLPPNRPSGAPVVFGSFNNVMKLSPRTLALWSQVLHAVPNSKLLLKAPSLRDVAVRDRFLWLFGEHHIDADRLEFQGPTELASMMQSYGEIDIALDPTPYNGGTTSLQALWMGVPLVSLVGGNFVSRMGASFLSTLGRIEWLATTDADYVRIAKTLANQVDELRQSRQQFRHEMAASPLCDIERYVHDFQALLERMWDVYDRATCNRFLSLDSEV